MSRDRIVYRANPYPEGRVHTFAGFDQLSRCGYASSTYKRTNEAAFRLNPCAHCARIEAGAEGETLVRSSRQRHDELVPSG